MSFGKVHRNASEVPGQLFPGIAILTDCVHTSPETDIYLLLSCVGSHAYYGNVLCDGAGCFELANMTCASQSVLQRVSDTSRPSLAIEKWSLDIP